MARSKESPLVARVVVIEHTTLDGIYQAPARADEDTRDGFEAGGWAGAGDDPKMQEMISHYMMGGWSLLVGRVTFEGLYEGWVVRQPEATMTRALTNVQKYVASHTGTLSRPWDNATALGPDAVEAVAALKGRDDGALIVFGSGALVGSLMDQGLVDEFLLMVHPVILGHGRRLFDRAAPASLTLREQMTTETGVVIAKFTPSVTKADLRP